MHHAVRPSTTLAASSTSVHRNQSGTIFKMGIKRPDLERQCNPG
ncbi:unnamed protein product [Chondrus crispus]|uniref:Uncharacterized protein n=1 Tax=Chondrus crispus TaxID=2769 RepID=R7QD03_CHOCR|nr:unnamed protein product [Chondrus crispus]CDF35944.1 unnamed protein product [Chondrus crispus]|eukprot:XP_005715763.1 unnamed protein product [Chondrus crispus]